MKQPAVISPPLAIYNSAFHTQTEGRGGSKKTIQRQLAMETSLQRNRNVCGRFVDARKMSWLLTLTVRGISYAVVFCVEQFLKGIW